MRTSLNSYRSEYARKVTYRGLSLETHLNSVLVSSDLSPIGQYAVLRGKASLKRPCGELWP